eukprot:240272-Amphidinium_carterae.1
MALQHATEALRADREVVLAAVAQNFKGSALRPDPAVVLPAVQNDGVANSHPAAHIPRQGALNYAADCLLEDPTFATEAKRQFHLLKLTMLSGTSTVVAVGSHWDVQSLLHKARERLAALDGTTMELWHGQDRVPDDGTRVRSFPGLQPRGEITEYQLIVRDGRAREQLECNPQ